MMAKRNTNFYRSLSEIKKILKFIFFEKTLQREENLNARGKLVRIWVKFNLIFQVPRKSAKATKLGDSMDE
jgi:hypothetical protein